MKTRVYLDNCCLNRPHDNQTEISVQHETEAVTFVREQIYSGKMELAWSFVLEYEIAKNSNRPRKDAIAIWRHFSVVSIEQTEEVYRRGRDLEQYGLRSMDALHIACAMMAQCGYFLTTDKKILNKQIKGIKIMNPVEFIQKAGGGK